MAWRGLVIAALFAVVAAGAAIGPLRLGVAVGAVAVLALATRATMALGARIDRDALAARADHRRGGHPRAADDS